MTLHAHLTYPPDADTFADLQRQLLPNIQITTGDDVPPTTDILVAGRPSQKQLMASSQLRALVIPWAGLPEPTREIMLDFPQIAIHNLHHNAVTTAEMALSLLLAAAKLIVPFDQSLRRHDWSWRYKRPSPSILLSGKTALILGYGAIGQRVARLCRALDMTVLATRRQLVQSTDGVAHEIHTHDALHELLFRTHILINCLPHTPETDGLIGAKELALLRKPSILVNIGRGAVVSQKALYEALQTRAMNAAGLDVWYTYPSDKESRTHTPPADYPFHALENVVMSPHRGGMTNETERLRMVHLARLLNAATNGEPIPNQVDAGKGY